MSLDKALHDVVYYRIERTMRRVKAHTRQMFREQQFGVTIDQWVVLKRISEASEGLSQAELSNGVFKDPAAITRILDQLSKRGLVTRVELESDRRVNLLTLTTTGLDLVRRMTPHVQDLRAKGLQFLSPEEAEQLKKLLDKMYAGLEP